MAAGSTYTPISTTTIGGSPQGSLTFSSIPSTYTDLVIVASKLTSGSAQGQMYFNGDNSSGLYSVTYLAGNGSAASSSRNSGQNQFTMENVTLSTTTDWVQFNINIMNYSNSTTYKTFLSRTTAAGYGTEARVGLWRNTAAITSVTLLPANGLNFTSGSTFTLYGIQAA